MAVTTATLAKVKADVLAVIDELKKNKDWSLDNINAQIDVLQATVVEIEQTAKDIGGMLGVDKRNLAIAILLPLIPTSWVIPTFIKTYVIGKIIDVTIALFNKNFGNSWLGKVLEGK